MWRDGKNDLPAFPPGTRFSPAAQDFIKAQRLTIRFEAETHPAPAPPPEAQPPEAPPAWDKPGAFPVVFSGPTPVCSACGQPVSRKPDHLTQLDAGHFAPKTNPRIRLRGRLDSLHAATMLAAAEARRYQLPRLAAHLDSLAAYVREILSAEYHGRPVQPLALAGKSEAEIHEISHWPQRHLGLEHIVPGPEDHAILHWLNHVRTLARETEIDALEAYPPAPAGAAAQPAPNLSQALNRLSSTVYYLELLFRAGKLSWQADFPGANA